MSSNRETTKAVVATSAALRGEGRFNEAIALVERHLADGNFDQEVLTNIYLEVFRAAQESGNQELTSKYARLINAREPGLPSVQRFL